MITLSGKSVFGGVAIGKIAFYKRQEKQVRRYHVEDTEAEADVLRMPRRLRSHSSVSCMTRQWKM